MNYMHVALTFGFAAFCQLAIKTFDESKKRPLYIIRRATTNAGELRDG